MKENKSIVCLKPEDRTTGSIVATLVLTGLGIAAVSIIDRFYSVSRMYSPQKALEKFGMDLPFAAVFLFVDIAALVGLFAPHKKMRGTLLEINQLDNEYSLVFELNELYYINMPPEHKKVKCKVKDLDFLVVGEEYALVFSKIGTYDVKEIHSDPYEASIDVPIEERAAPTFLGILLSIIPLGGICFSVLGFII